MAECQKKKKKSFPSLFDKAWTGKCPEQVLHFDGDYKVHQGVNVWEVPVQLQKWKVDFHWRGICTACSVYTITAREILQALFGCADTARFIWLRCAEPSNIITRTPGVIIHRNWPSAYINQYGDKLLLLKLKSNFFTASQQSRMFYGYKEKKKKNNTGGEGW